MRPAFFLSTIKKDARNIDIGSQTISITKTQMRMQAGVAAADSGNHYSPRLYYNNGRTYLSFINPTAAKPYGQAKILEFHGDYGFGRPFVVGPIPSASDDHSISVVQANALGVYTFQEQLHNTPVNVYKSQGPTDVSQHSWLEQFGDNLAYVNILDRIGGDKIAWMRGYDTQTSIYQVLSSSGLEGWGSQVRITATPDGGPPTYRHYPFLPNDRWYAVGKYTRLITKRKDQGAGGYFYRFHAVQSTPANLKIFTNLEGTYTHDVDVDGLLTDTILEANFMYHSMDGNGDIQGNQPRVAISPTGGFYTIVRQADGTDNWYFKYYRNGAWVTKALVIPNIGYLPEPFSYIFAFSDTDVRIVVRINEGTYYRPHMFKTVDRGDNWTDLGDMCPEFTTGNVNVLIPNNLSSVPENQNFPLIFTARDAVDTEWVNVVCKVGAFGSIQTLVAEPVVGAAIANYNSSGLYYYKGTDANIVRSGNNVSQLTDIFGVRNATGINNPQWNGSNGVSLLQASQNRFAFTNLATLLNKDAMTFIVAASFTPGVGAVIFGATLASSSSVIWELVKRGDNNKLYYRVTTALGSADFQTDGTIADSNIHIIAITVPGRAGVMPNVWIDGRLQYFEHVTLTNASPLTQWNQLGRGPVATTATTAYIGLRDLSGTDLYSTMTLYDDVAFGMVLPKDVLQSYTKGLCDEHSVTYVGEYEIPT